MHKNFTRCRKTKFTPPQTNKKNQFCRRGFPIKWWNVGRSKTFISAWVWGQGKVVVVCFLHYAMEHHNRKKDLFYTSLYGLEWIITKQTQNQNKTKKTNKNKNKTKNKQKKRANKQTNKSKINKQTNKLTKTKQTNKQTNIKTKLDQKNKAMIDNCYKWFALASMV